jgi:glucoamylase
MLVLRNRPPGTRSAFPAKDIVDAGFLDLVRYGIRAADDPLIVDSLRVIDGVLEVDTPLGRCWHRYNNDGYGEHQDGAPFSGFGRGRAWPLLTAERGHYELAAGHDVRPFVRAMEAFAGNTGLLPEQVWDEPNRPEFYMKLGRPTGAAMPLIWAHAEYIKLLRSTKDGAVFDRIPAVVARYQEADPAARTRYEIWKFNRRPNAIQAGCTLRILAAAAFKLRWTADEWRDACDSPSQATSVGVDFVDVPVPANQMAPLRFTFFWTGPGRWEGKDFSVAIDKASA